VPKGTRSAWNAGDVAALASLYRERSWAKMERLLPQTFTRRGWIAADGESLAPPALGPPQRTRDLLEGFEYTYGSPEGPLEVTLRLQDDARWVVASLELPRR